MCGRIALYTPPARLARIFGADLASEVDEQLPPTFNLPPTESVLAVVTARQKPGGADQAGGGIGAEEGATTETADGASDHGSGSGPGPARLIRRLRWGLVPSWAKDLSTGNRMFNARAEGLLDKPAYRNAFARRRCLVLADGFFEWRGRPAGAPKRAAKTPYFFTRTDGQPLALAGVWEIWRDPALPPDDPANRLRSCTIVTCRNGPDLDGIHDRVPVIVERPDFDTWLGARPTEVDDLLSLLEPAPGGTLVRHRVRPLVNKVDNDGPELIDEIPDEDPAESASEGAAGSGPAGPVHQGRFEL